MPHSLRAPIAILIATIIWSIAPVIFKLGLEQVPPFSFTFFRFVLTSILMAPFIYRRGNESIRAADFGKMVLAGSLLAIHIALIFYALTLTQVTSLNVLFSLGPLLTSIASVLYLKEKVSKRFFLGVPIAVLGTLVIVFKPTEMDLGAAQNILLGNVCILLSLIASTSFTVFSKNVVKNYSPVTFMSIVFPVSAVLLVPLVIWEIFQYGNWTTNLGFAGIWGIVFGAVFSSLIAYLLYEYGIKHAKVFQVGAIGFIEPILGASFSVWLLQESIHPVFIVGALLIIGGVGMATLHLPHHRHHSHKY